ncbi:hypothetical protein H3C65_00075 [Patescibacteria group bacterium]|nr:hypothetical protein [Patescibacteria group bacterium]
MEDREILRKNQKSKAKSRNWPSFLLIVLLAVIARLVPHIPNFVPITGLALFSGAHFKNKISFLIPLAAMAISDIFLGFHNTIPYVYLSFIVIFFIGRLIKKTSFLAVASASLISAVLFFLITNFGVWQAGSMYPKTVEGLLQCYLMGLPFFRNTVLGDLFYSFLFFYGFKFLPSATSEVANRPDRIG